MVIPRTALLEAYFDTATFSSAGVSVFDFKVEFHCSQVADNGLQDTKRGHKRLGKPVNGCSEQDQITNPSLDHGECF